MPRKPLLLVLAAILLAVLYLLLTRSGGLDAPEAGADGASAAADPGGANAPGEQAPEGRIVPAERLPVGAHETDLDEAEPQPEEAAAEVAYLHGKVVDDRGEPIAGAWVASAWEAEVVHSDREGLFRMAVDPDAWDAGGTLYACAPGKGPRSQTGVADEFWVIRLLPAVEREYQVVRKGDLVPIEGARARLVMRHWSAATDRHLSGPSFLDLPMALAPSGGDGVLRVPASPPDNTTAFLVEKEGFQPALGPDYAVESELYAGVVVLAPEGSLRVRFLLADGSPMSGATVAFGDETGALQTDAGGYVEIPPLLRGGVRTFTAELDGIHWWQQLSTSGRLELEPDQEFLIGHHPRAGTLDVGDRGRPQDFEIATGAGDEESSGLWPSARHQPELLDWAPIESDDSFTVTAGWQGVATGFFVRRVGDAAVVLEEKVEGPGPYSLKLDPVHAVTLHVVAEPMSVLDGARLRLGRDAEVALQNGSAVAELARGSYRPALQLQGSEQRIYLGDLYVRDRPLEKTFELGRMRTVSGRITANGKPVFPCELSLWGSERLNCTLHTDRDGAWQADGLPEQQLNLYPKPKDPWLVLKLNTRWVLPSSSQRFDIELPVATLNMRTADPGSFDPTRIFLNRKNLPEDGDDYFDLREHPFMPDLRQGSATVLVTPCVLTVRTRDFYSIIEPSQVELRDGEVKGVVFRQTRLGVLTIRLSDSGDRMLFGQRITLTPASGQSELTEEQRAHRRPSRRGEEPSLASWKVEPETWTLSVQGPVYAGWGENKEYFVREDQSWTGTVRVEAGRQTVVELRVTEAGDLAAEFRMRE